MNRIPSLLIFQLLLVFPAIAQQEAEISKKLEALHYFTGIWNVEVEARLSANGPWETSIARSDIKFTTASKILEEEFTGTREGKPFFTKMLIAVNNLTGAYQRIFADSEHGALVDFEGTRKGNSYLFDKLWTYPNKTTVQLRVEYTIVSDDEFTVESMRMPQGTMLWDTTGRMKYKRVK